MTKLYNDDCSTVMQQLISEDVKVDCIVVDLPYFQVVKDEFDNQWKDEQEYLNWVRSVFNITRDLIKEDGNIIVFCSRQYARKISNIFDYEMMWVEKRQIIWARKRGFNNTRGHALASGYEPILYWTNGEYLITDKHHWVSKDTWNGKHWVHHYDEDVMAFCLMIDIPSYKF